MTIELDKAGMAAISMNRAKVNFENNKAWGRKGSQWALEQEHDFKTATALTTLSAELEQVKRERDTWRERASINIDQHRSENTRLSERLAEANKALEPFAKATGHFDGYVKDDDDVSVALRDIKARHLRAARRALNAGGE